MAGWEKDWGVVNDVKLRGIISYQGAFEKLIFLCAEHMGSWMISQGAMVNSTVLVATGFCCFYVLVITLNPLTFKIILTVACRPFLCITRLAAATEVSSFHVTMIYVNRSSTSTDKPSPLTAYTDNP